MILAPWIEIFVLCTVSQHLIMLFLFCCIGRGEGLWIDPPPLLDPRFRRAPLELSCVGFEFRMIFILRCRFPCCTGRAYSLVLCMNIRRVAWPWFLNVTVVIETALVSFIWRPTTMVFPMETGSNISGCSSVSVSYCSSFFVEDGVFYHMCILVFVLVYFSGKC